ncbi:hypothetical protein [Photobacterium leiognathi]|uniref:hypothetical protein n=1 Tax=Photobacterium leiognathi TaxID=553611 RepID=UPI0029815A9C|nr:hypothetical protein [Photobacterium leiognathi]
MGDIDTRINNAYAEIIGTCECQYCGGGRGHDELVHTGDNESLGGYEVWFCCHDCRDSGRSSETFIKLEENGR